jgi:hypothetical protein
MKIQIRVIAIALISTFLVGCSSPAKFMPNVSGKDKSEVSEIMSGLGLNVNFETSYSDTVPQGVAIDSQPGPGEELSGLDSVTVVISDGLEPVIEWAPAGFTQLDDEIAFRWAEPTGDPCGGPECLFWRAEVVTNTGCPGGVYAEINFVDGTSVLDWTNDTVSALSPGQTGQLTFKIYGWGNSPFGSAELTDLSCN